MFHQMQRVVALCFRENYIKASTTSWAKRFAKDINFDDYVAYLFTQKALLGTYISKANTWKP